MAKRIEITEIEGFRFGHGTDKIAGTGCTAIIAAEGAVAGVDVRGGAPATIETDVLRSENTVQKIHGVMLAGGSAYGLGCTAGAMRFLEERGYGHKIGRNLVPIVSGAAIYDLDAGATDDRPGMVNGYDACFVTDYIVPGDKLEEGNVGAGTGATVGKLYGSSRRMKSGTGVYALQEGEVKLGAITAVNALGDVYDFETGKKLAGLLSEDGEELADTEIAMLDEMAKGNTSIAEACSGKNTTISCVVTNAKLTKLQANRLAAICHDAYARTIRPVHTTLDGDTVFVMASGEVEVSEEALEVLAVKVLGTAISRSVKMADKAYMMKVASDFAEFPEEAADKQAVEDQIKAKNKAATENGTFF